MDAWHRTFDQLRSVCRSLSVAQRISVLIVTLGVLTGMGWLAFVAGHAPDQFLLGGKSFSIEELSRTQAALKSAGLTAAKVVGQKISVPADQADRYTAAALAQQTLPAQFAAEFDRMQAKVNVFTSTEQRRELLEEARKTRLAQILRSIPEIEDAVVEWDRPRATSLFRPAPQLAAHVSVKPRGGRELSPELVQSLKLFIAGALAGAQTDDVTVVDMNTSRVYGRRSVREAESERNQGIAKQHAAEYTEQCQQALRYIPDVLVSVNVEMLPDTRESNAQESFVGADIVPVRRQRDRTRTIESFSSNRPAAGLLTTVSTTHVLRDLELERSFNGTPQPIDDEGELDGPVVASSLQSAVRVSVSVPEDYYSVVARSRGLTPGQSLADDSAYRAGLASIKAETRRDVRETLIRLLPVGNDPAAVSITTYTPLRSGASTTVVTDASKDVGADAGSIRHVVAPGVTLATVLEVLRTHWKIGTGFALCGGCLIWVGWRVRPRGLRPVPNLSFPAPVHAETIQPELDVPNVTDPAPPPSNPHAAVLDKLAELERMSPPVLASQTNPFAFLTELSVIEAAQLLEHEHPQTIALVATALAPNQAAEILHALPESLRWDVTQRLARIGTATPDVLREVAASLEARRLPGGSTHVASRPEPAAPSPFHAEHRSPQRSEVSTVETAASTATAVEASPSDFNFEDLLSLDRESLAAVWESVEPRSCAVALLDRSESFKQALLAKLPRQASEAVRQHQRHLGPVRMSDITTHQEAIAEAAWKAITNYELRITN